MMTQDRKKRLLRVLPFVYEEETGEAADALAHRVFNRLRRTRLKHPEDLILVGLQVEGHRNQMGGYDTAVHHFVTDFLLATLLAARLAHAVASPLGTYTIPENAQQRKMTKQTTLVVTPEYYAVLELPPGHTSDTVPAYVSTAELLRVVRAGPAG